MKITIVRDDNYVIINGEGRTVDLSSLPANIHAIQWDSNEGEIEYGKKVPGLEKFNRNERITDISPWQSIIDAWNAAAPPPPPHPPPPLTVDEIIDSQLSNDKLIKAIVEVLAEHEGITKQAMIAKLKQKAKGVT